MKKLHATIILLIILAIIGVMLVYYFFMDFIPPIAKIKCEKFTHVARRDELD